MTVFHWPQRVTIREVGLRDGLQSIARTLPTAQKLQWIQWLRGQQKMKLL